MGAALPVLALAEEEYAVPIATTHAWEQPLVPITDYAEGEAYDVIVVGAGVAGCAAAAAAAENGASVLLVEKSSTITSHRSG